jgi:hypothetical protein
MALDIERTTYRILCKMDTRTRVGWIDYSVGSWTWRVAHARAFRISARTHGIRLPLAPLLRD